MFETKSGIFLIGGIGFFLLSFLVMGVVPWTIDGTAKERTVEQLAGDGMTHEFVDLAERFPKQFQQHFPAGATTASYVEALELGHQVYVAEACWHCHSQYIRPISNEDRRWGPVSYAVEYQNKLQRPVLFGTRRVGPDLIREAARRSNDWHVAHFSNPRAVVPTSVMPTYSWFFDEEGYPNKKGLAVITYVQWLGSWLSEYPYYLGEGPFEKPSKETAPNDDTAQRTESGT